MYRMPVVRAAGCLVLCSLVGCTGLNKTPTRPDLQPWPEIRADFRIETLRQRLYEYSTTFAAEVDLAATAIERRATDATVRRNALLWRVRAIPEMRKACFRIEPVSGLVDAWTFARQMDHLFSTGAGASVFGTFQPEAVAVSRRLLEQVRVIAASIAVSPEARGGFEQRIIDPWLADYPLRDITFVRESPIARFSEQTREQGDVMQSVGTMEELAISLSQQARIYLADLPRQMRGEVDLMRTDMLSAQEFGPMLGDVHTAAGATDRIASTVETMAPLIENERKIILEETNRQRALVMDALSVERERAIAAIVGALAAERTALLRDVELQRLATLAWATTERREALAEVLRELGGAVGTIRSERAIVVDDLRNIVDLVLLRVALFLVAGVVLAPLVAHVYARVWPRRRPPIDTD
jgi:hypothetical protein